MKFSILAIPFLAAIAGAAGHPYCIQGGGYENCKFDTFAECQEAAQRYYGTATCIRNTSTNIDAQAEEAKPQTPTASLIRADMNGAKNKINTAGTFLLLAVAAQVAGVIVAMNVDDPDNAKTFYIGSGAVAGACIAGAGISLLTVEF